jgi:CheY-like chemotaxis protein
VLETYDIEAFNNRKQKSSRRKKFDEKHSRFEASVLVAEDNIINQKLIRRTLEDIGLEVTVANNGLEAFEKRKNGQFDLIFMDIQMPVLDGIEATQEILDYEEDYDQHHIPIIALTANALKGDRERFLAAGMDEYTTKPLVRSEIIALLNNFLSHKIVEINVVPKTADHLTNANAVQVAVEPVKDLVEPVIETFVEEIEEPIIADEEDIEEVKSTSVFDADVLLAKQNTLEMKLFSRILNDLGYTYETVNTASELLENVTKKRYKVALFDKTLIDLNLKELYDTIRDKNSDTSLVMLIDPNAKEDPNDAMYVHEIIKNIVNSDLLRLVFEKFI